MSEQKIFFAAEDLICHVKKFSPRNIFLVHGRTFNRLSLAQIFNDFQTTHFTDFKPNPLFESVEAGIKVFGENNCDMIIAIGGGSSSWRSTQASIFGGGGMVSKWVVRQSM